MSREAMTLALEALELLARYENPETKIQVRKKGGGPIVTVYPHKIASDAAQVLRAALDAPPVLWYHPLSGRVRFEETSKWTPLFK